MDIITWSEAAAASNAMYAALAVMDDSGAHEDVSACAIPGTSPNKKTISTAMDSGTVTSLLNGSRWKNDMLAYA